MNPTLGYRFVCRGTEEKVLEILSRLAAKFRTLPVGEVRGPLFRDRFESYALAVIARVERGDASPPEGFDEHLRFLGAPIPWVLPCAPRTVPDPGVSPFPRRPSRSAPEARLRRRGGWVRIETSYYAQDVHPATENRIARHVRAYLVEGEPGEGCEPFRVRLAQVGSCTEWAGLGTIALGRASPESRLAVVRMLEECDEESILFDVRANDGYWALGAAAMGGGLAGSLDARATFLS